MQIMFALKIAKPSPGKNRYRIKMRSGKIIVRDWLANEKKKSAFSHLLPTTFHFLSDSRKEKSKHFKAISQSTFSRCFCPRRVGSSVLIITLTYQVAKKNVHNSSRITNCVTRYFASFSASRLNLVI